MTVLAAAAALACPAAALAGDREAPRQGPLPPGVALPDVPDVVLAAESGRMRAARATGRTARVYSASGGHSVEVEVSTSYPEDPAIDQELVDFHGSRLHGDELSGLRVFVGTPGEIGDLCGGQGALACYAIAEARMYVPGEAVDGIPVEYPLTHEYGHHLASWRLNTPWDALDWGPKHWASAARVCTHVRKGLLFPGNQGAHYFDDPGEGFADGYAHLHYPQVSWQYNQLMRPRPALFAAIRRDVLEPWSGPRRRTLTGRVGPHGRRTFRIPVRLDGDLKFRLTSAPGAVYEVEARAGGFAAGRRLRDGRGFGVEWCRRRAVEHVAITVRRRAGAGPFALRVSWPG